MNPLLQVLTVGVAGFAGAVTRFGINLIALRLTPDRTWLATLAINLTGSFALGWFLSAFGERFSASHPARLAVAVGFLGAYTTFSTFTYEADSMMRRGEWVTSTFYLGGSVLLGLLACAAGTVVGR